MTLSALILGRVAELQLCGIRLRCTRLTLISPTATVRLFRDLCHVRPARLFCPSRKAEERRLADCGPTM